jgi:hypothetical protein
VTSSNLVCHFDHKECSVHVQSVEHHQIQALSAANSCDDLTDDELELSIWSKSDEDNGSLNPKFMILSSSSFCCA